MADVCPKCYAELEKDDVCCATLEHTWKCGSCGKLTAGLVVPFGRCHLCGGTVSIVEPYPVPLGEAARLVEEAMRLELEMLQFYRLARRRAMDASQKAVFEQLYLKELDHLAQIESKYHLHPPAEALETDPGEERLVAEWLFEGIDFAAPGWSVSPLYEKALTMERRTRDHFARRAQEMPTAREREICRELAAEEEEHVALLEIELAMVESLAAAGS